MVSKRTLVFLIKRLLLFYPIGLISIMIFCKNDKSLLLVGFTLGVIVSILKVIGIGCFILDNKIVVGSKKKHVIATTFKYGIILLFLVMVAHFVLKIGDVFFLAFASGILLLNLVVFINAVTEVLTITNNNFE